MKKTPKMLRAIRRENMMRHEKLLRRELEQLRALVKGAQR